MTRRTHVCKKRKNNAQKTTETPTYLHFTENSIFLNSLFVNDLTKIRGNEKLVTCVRMCGEVCGRVRGVCLFQPDYTYYEGDAMYLSFVE